MPADQMEEGKVTFGTLFDRKSLILILSLLLCHLLLKKVRCTASIILHGIFPFKLHSGV
jgi:hypothetical protein